MNEPKPVYDAGDEVSVRGAKQKHKLAKIQHDADTRTVMGTPAGRRFMWRLLGGSGIYGRTFETDPMTVGKFLGRREQGLDLLAELMTVCLPEYLLMETEARTQEKQEESNG